MPNTINNELRSLAEDLKADHGEIVTSAACLVQMTRSLLESFGQQNGVNVGPLIDLQCRMAREWLIMRGASGAELVLAMGALRQAGETASYLSAIPA